MKKKNIKPLVLSSLAALSLGSMSVAGTFALFTDQAETTISIGAAEVSVKNAMTIEGAYSLNGAEVGTAVAEGKKSATYVNGGQATVKDVNGETTEVEIKKWTPGDGVKLRTAPVNGSNVTIKVRLKVVITGPLAPALVMRVYEAGGSAVICAATGERTLVTDWAPVAPAANPTAFDLDVRFPDHDNGEIKFGEENKDNQYQNKGATIKVSYEAVQGNADVSANLLERINTTLATNEVKEGKNVNMYEAVNDLAVADVATLAQIKANNYVWGADEDLFYEAAGIAAGEKYKYFKTVSSQADAGDFSIYAYDGWNTPSVSLTGVGFDAGNAEGITSVSYVGIQDTPRANIIRTNSAGTSLTVNAPLDTIYHYGSVGSLVINAIAGNSYHENGKVAFAEIKTGRLALEKGADVERIHLSTSEVNEETVFNNIIIAKDEEVEMPAFSRDPVEIPDEGRLVVALQEGTEQVTEQTELDYVWLTAIGVYEQVVVSDQKESLAAEGANNTYAADSTNQEKKDTAQQIANNITATVGEEEYELKATPVVANNVVTGWTYTLESTTTEATITEAVTVAVVENVQEEKEVVVSVAAAEKTTVTENGIDSSTKEAIKEDAIDGAKSDETADTAITATKGDIVITCSLDEFRDRVNGLNNHEAETFEGYVVKLNSDVSLKNKEWTPIGTASHPFKGVFDGQGHAIKRFVVNSTTGYAGLFGEIQGTQNDNAMALQSVYSNDTFIEDSFAEANYTAVVKNLTISNATVTETGNKKGTGALAGRINDAYIANIVVSSSTITGYKAIGGISGCFNGSMAKNCRTLSSVAVVAGKNGYHAGGLFGGVIYEEGNSANYYTAVVGCENNASVTVMSDGANGGSAGGIVAWSQNFKSGNSIETSGALYVNCVNNGRVEYLASQCQAIGGIAGFGNNGVAFINCSNTGNITANTLVSSNAGGMAGISFGGYAVHNCSNSGTLTGTTTANTKMAGVYIDYIPQTGGTGVAHGCTNTGLLNNSDTTAGRTAQIAFAGGLVSFVNHNFNNVQEIQEALLNNGNYSYEFINCTVSDKIGTLDLTGISGNIYADNNLCETIKVTDSNVAIRMPNVSIVVPAGSSGFSLSSMGDNSSVTVAEGASVNGLTLGGQGSSLVVYGTVTGSIALSGDFIQATIKEGALASKVNFYGTGSYVLTNKGTISHNPSTAYRNEHTLSTITACHIVVNNYGLIEAKNYNGQDNTCAYAMLFYGGSDVVVNQYYGSSIVAESNNMTVAPYSANSVIYNYYDVDGNLTNTTVIK